MIETERLVLRPPAPDDLPWVLAHINTPMVMRYLGGKTRSPDEVAAGLEADIAAFANGGHRRWTVWLRDGERRVGRCGLFHVGTDAAPEPLRGSDGRWRKNRGARATRPRRRARCSPSPSARSIIRRSTRRRAIRTVPRRG